MSFSSQRDVRYFVNQFYYWLLIRCMKTPAVLKRQRFEENGSDKTEPKESKRRCLDDYDDEEENSLDENEGEIESTRCNAVTLGQITRPRLSKRAPCI